MATYKNDYTKKEDNTLWELHEIRHALHEMRKSKNIAQINRDARKKYNDWQQGAKVKKAG